MKLLPILFACLFLLSGCSGSPSAGDVEDQVVDKLARDGMEELFSVENFEKSDGLEKDDNTYVAYVEYDLVANMSLDEYVQAVKEKSEGSPLSGMRAGLGVMALKMQYGNFKSGQSIHKEEEITLFKTEKGWRISE